MKTWFFTCCMVLFSLSSFSQQKLVDVQIKVYSANLYCGEDQLSEKKLRKHQDKHEASGEVIYSINLSKQAKGNIDVLKWVSNQEAQVEANVESGEYLLLDEEKFNSIVKDSISEEKRFKITGAYLRSLVLSSSARLYIPVDPKEVIELVLWKPCNN